MFILSIFLKFSLTFTLLISPKFSFMPPFHGDRLTQKAPATIPKNARARRFGEMSTVAGCRKGLAVLGKRAVADVGIQSGADLRKAERALRSA